MLSLHGRLMECPCSTWRVPQQQGALHEDGPLLILLGRKRDASRRWRRLTAVPFTIPFSLPMRQVFAGYKPPAIIHAGL